MQKYLIEFLGSFILIYVFLTTRNPIAIGITLAFLMMFLESNTGFNPVFIFAKVYTGEMSSNKIIPYCLAEILGGITAVQIFHYVNIIENS